MRHIFGLYLRPVGVIRKEGRRGNDMPTELWAPLVIAAITGLAFIAYKHPTGFKRINLPLVALSLIIFVSMMIWNVAISKGYTAIMLFLDPAKFEKASVAVKDIQVNADLWFVVMLVFNVYLGILWWLPVLIKDESKD